MTTNALDLAQFPTTAAGCIVTADSKSFLSDSASNVREKDWQSTVSAIGRMINLRDDWDDMGAAAPELGVIALAMRLAEIFSKDGSKKPDRVIATPMGAVSFEWIRGLGSLDVLEVTNSNTFSFIEYREGVIVHRRNEHIPSAPPTTTPSATSSDAWDIAV